MNIEFQLKAELKCSGSLSDAVSSPDLTEFVKYCNESVLKKGAPPGCGAEITWWDVAGEKIGLKIVSDRFVRAHDALFRLKNEFGKFLGKHRIGIRGIEIEDYEIGIEWEEGLRIKKLPFVKEIKQEEGILRLFLDVDESALEKRIPDRILKLLEDKCEAARWKGKSEHWELLFERGKRDFYFDKDPTEELIKRGWIRHAAGRGQWIYGPQLTKIFRAFERALLEEVCKPLGYEEMIFPKFVPWDVWKRSGHAKGIYPEAYYVCTPKTRDPEYWEEVMDYYKVTNEIPLDMIMDRIELVGGMCYAQCPPFWIFLQGKTIPDEILPITVFDRSGTSHRYESGGLHGIERLDEFHRVEIVWIGKKEQVIKHAKQLQEGYRRIFEEFMDIEWREAWVTPWFMAQEGKAGLAESKEVGTTDYEAVLPYSGKWLEFQNVSVNGNKYPKGFSVKLQSGEELWSGCSGVGLERWAAVFLAQNGFESHKWPEKFRTIVGELPEVFRFL
ncbi:Type-2 serine--tRNA ligase [ANME-1 cluster archaeon GoMg1]|nr:Type-2 serine--tRNA ligase [ANME-1 cluster archaeon GoMg1]